MPQGQCWQVFASGTGKEDGGACKAASTSPCFPGACWNSCLSGDIGMKSSLSDLISWGPDKRRHSRTWVQEVSLRVEKQAAASQHIPSLALIAPQRSRVQTPLPEKLVLLVNQKWVFWAKTIMVWGLPSGDLLQGGGRGRQCNPKETVATGRAASGETAGPRKAMYFVFISPKRLCSTRTLSRGFEARKQHLGASLILPTWPPTPTPADPTANPS